ncbi:MAG: hypothetical protein KME26_29830 [Oscillatoria princeps RMCB-10]|nr:hypothetical protein [Oscillatoria princeps RMCB-10]
MLAGRTLSHPVGADIIWQSTLLICAAEIPEAGAGDAGAGRAGIAANSQSSSQS